MRSYWEQNLWFKNIDYFIVGAGFTGLFSALSLRKKFKNARIVIADRDALAQGASTKNAGFACFGSLGEIIDDLTNESLDSTLNRVVRRFHGLKRFRSIIPDKESDFESTGGHELFRKGKEADFQACLDQLDEINTVLEDKLGFSPYQVTDISSFGFNGFIGSISIANEGMLNPAKAVQVLRKQCAEQNITILNGCEVSALNAQKESVSIETNLQTIEASNVILATNAFSGSLLGKEAVKPARGQVLITSPIKNLPFTGTFHIDKGFYYFRNVGNRVLLGGARNIDFETETSTTFELNNQIQRHLEVFLKDNLLPHAQFEIEHRWSGIMGFGHYGEKEPVIKELLPNVFTAYRLGGMGVALSAQVAEDVVCLIN